MAAIEGPTQSTDSAEGHLLERIVYRTATPTDILQCFGLEKVSYSPEESASKNELRYFQHHAARFFRCAVLEHEDEDVDEDEIVGYICSTRCEPDDDDQVPKSHHASVTSLMIHSVVVRTEYQDQGLGKHMMEDYLHAIKDFNESTEIRISKLLLFAKESQLGFYLFCGFSVLRPSRNVNGNGARFFLEKKLEDASSHHLSIFEKDAVKCYVVDSFASAPGTGNPAAVVMLPRETDPEAMAKWMHVVAAEFNLSETAFCWPTARRNSSADEHWDIRYYTPTVEILLCGHATLASAAVLYQTLGRQNDYRIVFHALEDDLTMEKAKPEVTNSALRTRISMTFPCKPPIELSKSDDKLTVRMMLEAAFSCKLDPLYVGISDIGDVLVELRPADFLEIGYDKINFKALMEWSGYFRGVIICCKCDENFPDNPEVDESVDFLSRFFGPKAGIDEDPVTGSAHCVLAPYFAKMLGKDMVIGKQMSKRRGIVECLLQENNVRITGTAITTVTGSLWMKKEETSLSRRVARVRSESILDDE